MSELPKCPMCGAAAVGKIRSLEASLAESVPKAAIAELAEALDLCAVEDANSGLPAVAAIARSRSAAMVRSLLSSRYRKVRVVEVGKLPSCACICVDGHCRTCSDWIAKHAMDAWVKEAIDQRRNHADRKE